MTGGLLAGGLLLAVPAGAGETPGYTGGFGPAVDWSLTGSASTRMAVDMNRTLDPDDPSDLLASNRFDVGLSLGAKTKRGVYKVDVGLSAPVYLGQNQPNEDWPVDPRFSASATLNGKDYTFTNSVAFDVSPTTETLFEDIGLITRDALQLSANYSTSLALRLDRNDTLTLSGSARVVDFIDGGTTLTPTRTFTAGVGWDHTLDARTNLGFDLSFRDYTCGRCPGDPQPDLRSRFQLLAAAHPASQYRSQPWADLRLHRPHHRP